MSRQRKQPYDGGACASHETRLSTLVGSLEIMLSTNEFGVFSVVIPTCNRPSRLRACLESRVRVEYPRAQFEVIVVDDGSSTSLKEIVSDYEPHLNITLLVQSNRGPAAARNAGARRAKGRFLAFTDDDCRPAPDWLGALSDVQQHGCVGSGFLGDGRVRHGLPPAGR